MASLHYHYKESDPAAYMVRSSNPNKIKSGTHPRLRGESNSVDIDVRVYIMCTEDIFQAPDSRFQHVFFLMVFLPFVLYLYSDFSCCHAEMKKHLPQIAFLPCTPGNSRSQRKGLISRFSKPRFPSICQPTLADSRCEGCRRRRRGLLCISFHEQSCMGTDFRRCRR